MCIKEYITVKCSEAIKCRTFLYFKKKKKKLGNDPKLKKPAKQILLSD